MSLIQDHALQIKASKGSFTTTQSNKDVGNVSQVCPAFHPTYTMPTDDGVSNHTKEFTKASITEEAYRLMIATSKGMAATAWKLLTDDRFAETVKAQFEAGLKQKQ